MKKMVVNYLHDMQHMDFAYIKENFNVIKIVSTTITALKSLCLVSRQVPLISYPHELSEEALKAASHSLIESLFHEHHYSVH